MGFIKEGAIKYLQKKGYSVVHNSQYRSDMEKDFYDIWEKAGKFTMISPERGYSIYKSVEYISKYNIPGSMVECGVWEGGACMIIALSLIKFSDAERKIFLYDTFEGMTKPDMHDCIAWSGPNMLKRWKENKEKTGRGLWAADIDSVRKNIVSTGYPPELLEFVKGDVAVTLENTIPERIALLRLDTDWYESTKAELEALYPVLVPKGVLIIDDYGHFTGARKAVDEFFDKHDTPFMLNRIDYTGRAGVKII